MYSANFSITSPAFRVPGAIDGLSIGFRTAKARIDPRTRIRRIYAVGPLGERGRLIPDVTCGRELSAHTGCVKQDTLVP